MSIRIDASGDRIRRTTNLIDYNAAYWVDFWYYIVANNGAPAQAIVTLSASGSAYDELYMNSSLQLQFEVGAAGTTTVAGSTLSTGTWYRISVVRTTDANIFVYLNGVLDITNTRSVAGRIAVVNFDFGSNAFSEWSDARYSAISVWATSGTAAEVANRITILPKKFDSINGWYPTFPGATERLADYSGNGRNWTEAGTLTDEDPPPVSWGARSLYPQFVAAAAGGTILRQMMAHHGD